MNLVKVISAQLASNVGLTIIRADQPGKLPDLPYATYKIIGGRKGNGRESIQHIDTENTLMENYSQERNTTISFNIYGTSHANAYETAKQLRKWFEWRGSLFLDEINVAVASISDVSNRSVFLVDAYDEKYGFDVIIRYIESDEQEVDYFDKVEYGVIIERE